VFCPVGTTKLQIFPIPGQAFEIHCFGSDQGRLVRIQQMSNGRYVDGHEEGNDHALVTRERQDNRSQVWGLTDFGYNTYTIYQASTGRYVDAYVTEDADYRIVTRDPQINNTQRWILTGLGDDIYTT